MPSSVLQSHEPYLSELLHYQEILHQPSHGRSHVSLVKRHTSRAWQPGAHGGFYQPEAAESVGPHEQTSNEKWNKYCWWGRGIVVSTQRGRNTFGACFA